MVRFNGNGVVVVAVEVKVVVVVAVSWFWTNPYFKTIFLNLYPNVISFSKNGLKITLTHLLYINYFEIITLSHDYYYSITC